ncbi:MAG: hypothetical protein KGN16_02640 [Burkholderiales bacterium]|nr:hypothetical protein [Burkholderiales bacterium]
MLSKLHHAENALRASEFAGALALARAALEDCAGEPARDADAVRARLLIGELLQLNGDIAPALDSLTRALADAMALNDPESIVAARCRLALSLSDSLGLYEQALANACEAYRLADAIHFEEGIIHALIRITGAYARVGDADRAERIGLMALSLSRDRHDAPFIWRSMTMLAVACNIVADDREQTLEYASAMLERGLAYARGAQHFSFVWGRADVRSMGYLTVAAALLRNGRPGEALDAIAQCLDIAQSFRLVNVELAALRERAACQIARGELDAAHRTLLQATANPVFGHHLRNRRLITKLLSECCQRLGLDAQAAGYREQYHRLEAEHEASRKSAHSRFSPDLPMYEDTFNMLARLADSGPVRSLAHGSWQWAAEARI